MPQKPTKNLQQCTVCLNFELKLQVREYGCNKSNCMLSSGIVAVSEKQLTTPFKFALCGFKSVAIRCTVLQDPSPVTKNMTMSEIYLSYYRHLSSTNLSRLYSTQQRSNECCVLLNCCQQHTQRLSPHSTGFVTPVPVAQ